ncbi:MAG: zinc ribbon domain-containing protein [Bdellovibrionales bacterium]
MNTVKGLGDFCKKHKVPIPVGDKFSLLDFLLEVSKRSMPLAEYRGRVTEVIQRMGNESEQWGGCPNCGSNVHLGLKECPVCGKSLDFVEPEMEANDLSDLDPEYSKPKKAKAVEDLDDFDEDESEEESADDLLAEESDEQEQTDEEDEGNDVDEIEEDDADEDAEEFEDHELEDEVSEENDSSEEEDTDFEEDEEPLSGPKKAAQKGNHFLSKKPINRPMTAHAEKYAEREVRRKKLESLIPKFKKDPNLVMRLKYRDLLIMPGLLGYTRKPTAIGSKQDIQRWIKNALKGGLKK